MAIAMTALKKADYDVEHAAALLSDDTHLMEIMREAENFNSTDKGMEDTI